MLTEFQLNVGGYAYTGASNEAAYAHLMDCDLRSLNNNCMWGYYVSVSAEGMRVDERPNYWPINENKTRVVYREPLLGVGTASRRYDFVLYCCLSRDARTGKFRW